MYLGNRRKQSNYNSRVERGFGRIGRDLKDEEPVHALIGSSAGGRFYAVISCSVVIWLIE